MKGKKLLISILSVLFILTAVGLGIHVLHKEALANTIVTCYAFDVFNQDVEGLELHVHFRLNGNDVDADIMNDDGDGNYSYDTFLDVPEYDYWDIELVDGATPIVPADWIKEMDPEDTHLDWKVDPD